MPSYSKTTIIGHVGRDPELRTVGQSSVLNFSVATSERYQGRDGEWKETTTWHNVQAWGKLAEGLSDRLQKGDLVFVEGQYQSYKGRNRQGADVVYWNLRAATVKRLNKREAAPQSAEPAPHDEAPAADFDPDKPHDESDIPDEDCPF